MEILPSRFHRLMAERGLDKMNRRPALQRMARMGMPQPVRGHLGESYPLCGGPDDAPGLNRGEGAPFWGQKHRVFGLGIRPAQPDESTPGVRRESDSAGFVAFPQHRDLAFAVSAGLQIFPLQAHQFRHPHARGVQQPQHSAVPDVRLLRNQRMRFCL